MRPNIRTCTVALALYLTSCAVGLWALRQSHRWRQGDEPHYAIMTNGLVNRGSFDVKPSYTSGDYIGTFFNEPIDFHINTQYFSPDSPMWYSYHSFGLPLLLSPFLLAAQQLHTRPLFALQIGMVLLQGVGVVLIYLYSLELVRHQVAAVLAALTLLSSMSFFGLVGRLFPDLLTATVLVGGLLCLARLRRKPRSLLPVAILSALAGFGPYLHVKTGLMSLTLLLLGLLHWWRNGRSRKMLGWLLVPAGVLVAIYTIKIHDWYGTWIVTAPFGSGLLFHFAPGKSIIANLFDTSRGILPNNPAFLLILAGIPLWWKRNRNSALVTSAVLLPSLFLQSTFADWAGGCSPVGGRYLMPLVFATLPAIAFLGAELSLLFRSALALLLPVQVAIGIYSTRGDYVCSYAGDNSPMLVSLAEENRIRPDLAVPIFSHELNLNDGIAVVQLLIGISIAAAVLFGGIVLARGWMCPELVEGHQKARFDQLNAQAAPNPGQRRNG